MLGWKHVSNNHELQYYYLVIVIHGDDDHVSSKVTSVTVYEHISPPQANVEIRTIPTRTTSSKISWIFELDHRICIQEHGLEA